MRMKIFCTALACIFGGLIWVCCTQQPGIAEQSAKYVGTKTCALCHADVVKKWQLTVHRRTLFNKDPSKQGCEGCHGPGGAHVAAGGDKTKIIRFEQLKPAAIAAICQKCHTQQEITLWNTSRHARAKLSCIQCHNPHSVGEKTMLEDIDNANVAIEGLSRSLKQAELEANVASGEDKTKAEAEVARLKVEQSKLKDQLKSSETAYKHEAEPYLCFNCHKAQEVQSHLPFHHPLQEGKVKCTSCHNPHGGPYGMLREESVTETCAKCHAEKLGPFTFEHPPVTEDCTICHTPHGSIQPNLLAQSQPFLCLKCHAAPHSRGHALGNPAGFAEFYNNCTSCHTQIHGSDQHSALHF